MHPVEKKLAEWLKRATADENLVKVKMNSVHLIKYNLKT
jgi:hypothetical protein